MTTIGSEPVQNPLPKQAAAYIAIVSAAGAAILIAALLQWRSKDPTLFGSFLLLALCASGWKVKLPRLTATISGGFVFLLIAMAELSWTEVVVMAALSGVAQCLWASKKKPQPVQVLFNPCVLVVSGWVAYHVSHLALPGMAGWGTPALLAWATFVLFTVNSILVSQVIGLVEARSLMSVWRQCYLWAFPCYLAGAAVANGMIVTGTQLGWRFSLLILPLLFMMYTYYREVAQRYGEEV